MVTAYLVDTNVLIDYLANALPDEYTHLIDSLIDSDGLYISVITQIRRNPDQQCADRGCVMLVYA